MNRNRRGTQGSVAQYTTKRHCSVGPDSILQGSLGDARSASSRDAASPATTQVETRVWRSPRPQWDRDRTEFLAYVPFWIKTGRLHLPAFTRYRGNASARFQSAGKKITQKAEATSYCGYRQVASIARILAHSWTFLFFADGEYSLEFRIGLEKSDRRGIRQRHSSISKSCRTGGITRSDVDSVQ